MAQGWWLVVRDNYRHISPLRPAPTSPALSQGVGLLASLRPRQWSKNLLIFAGLLFSGRLPEKGLWPPAFYTFLAYCLLASSVYLFNDVVDREGDRLHPKKCHRPIAAGIVAPELALLGSLFLAGAGLYLSLAAAGRAVASLSLAYLGLNVAYSLKLKEVPLLDILMVALCFVLRAVAGVEAVGVELSPWFLLCTLLLSLLLVLGKRRHELITLGGEAVGHREVLGRYSCLFLDQLISVITTATLVTYFLYTFFSPTGRRYALMGTIPPVLYGLFRYLYLVYEEGKGGEPEELLVRDPGILGSVLLWVASVVVVLYFL